VDAEGKDSVAEDGGEEKCEPNPKLKPEPGTRRGSQYFDTIVPGRDVPVVTTTQEVLCLFRQ